MATGTQPHALSAFVRGHYADALAQLGDWTQDVGREDDLPLARLLGPVRSHCLRRVCLWRLGEPTLDLDLFLGGHYYERQQIEGMTLINAALGIERPNVQEGGAFSETARAGLAQDATGRSLLFEATLTCVALNDAQALMQITADLDQDLAQIGLALMNVATGTPISPFSVTRLARFHHHQAVQKQLNLARHGQLQANVLSLQLTLAGETVQTAEHPTEPARDDVTPERPERAADVMAAALLFRSSRVSRGELRALGGRRPEALIDMLAGLLGPDAVLFEASEAGRENDLWRLAAGLHLRTDLDEWEYQAQHDPLATVDALARHLNADHPVLGVPVLRKSLVWIVQEAARRHSTSSSDTSSSGHRPGAWTDHLKRLTELLPELAEETHGPAASPTGSQQDAGEARPG